MGSKSSPAPAPAPAAPAAVVTPVDTSSQEDPANRAVARRAEEASASTASLLSSAGGDNLDPLTQQKQLTGGSAALMG